MIEVRYFASVRERVGVDMEQVEGFTGTSVQQLRQHLLSLDDAHARGLANDVLLLCAINETMATLDSALHDGDSVAFFPPVTGG